MHLDCVLATACGAHAARACADEVLRRRHCTQPNLVATASLLSSSGKEFRADGDQVRAAFTARRARAWTPPPPPPPRGCRSRGAASACARR